LKKSLAGREAKNFCSLGAVAIARPRPALAKVFLLLFFQKKKRFLLLSFHYVPASPSARLMVSNAQWI
jgi:hypothetical protein